VGKINPKNTASTSHSAADDALRGLVCLLARQAARDRLAGSPAPTDPTQREGMMDEQT
jgi:hypothetical protein